MIIIDVYKRQSYNSTSTESYIKSLYREKYGSESGTIFVIDMDNRNIWIHSNGAIIAYRVKHNITISGN